VGLDSHPKRLLVHDRITGLACLRFPPPHEAREQSKWTREKTHDLSLNKLPQQIREMLRGHRDDSLFVDMKVTTLHFNGLALFICLGVVIDIDFLLAAMGWG
jgi:hypothetical protein